MARTNHPTHHRYLSEIDCLDEDFIEKHGRQVNHMSDTYIFAQDEVEEERMDFEHKMFRLAIGGLFIGPVQDLLTRPAEQRRTVVDLGTGSGVWAMEMARKFPNVDVVGIDLVPIQRSITPPENFYFEKDDLNLSLDHYDGTIDYAHARLIAGGIRNYKGFIERLAGMVKPGGLLQVMETDFRSYYAKRDGAYFRSTKSPSDPNHLWFVDWQDMLVAAMRKKGANLEAGEMSRAWIADSPQWREVDYKDVWLPTGEFLPDSNPESLRENTVGRMLLTDIDCYVRHARPLLLDHFSVEMVDSVENHAIAEMRSTNRPRTWIRVTVVCAQRIANPRIFY